MSTQSKQYWITYDSVSALTFRGLGAVTIWGKKPIYREHVIQDDLPFGEPESERNGYYSRGWWHPQDVKANFGYFIGYDSELSAYIWDLLCKYFESDKLRDWESQAIKLNKQPKGFLITVTLDINIKNEI